MRSLLASKRRMGETIFATSSLWKLESIHMYIDIDGADARSTAHDQKKALLYTSYQFNKEHRTYTQAMAQN